MAQLVVVVQVLVAERDADDALHHQRLDTVLDQSGIAAVGEAGGEALDQPDRPVGRAQQQRAGIRVIAPPSNAATTARPSTGANSNSSGYTLSASGTSSASPQGFVAEELSPIQSPDAPTQREISGLKGTPFRVMRFHQL